jgi:4-oxalocrotonate tautomerase family enzyme
MTMPVIQIDLMEGHSSDVYHELIERCTALYAEIVAAPIERFRATVNVVPSDQWGLGGVPEAPRISPLIRILLMEGRPQELLHRLIAEMSALVAEILGIPLADTRVLVTEIPVTHWGIGGTPASLARAGEIAARAAAARVTAAAEAEAT